MQSLCPHGRCLHGYRHPSTRGTRPASKRLRTGAVSVEVVASKTNDAPLIHTANLEKPHKLTLQRLEVIQGMESWAEKDFMKYLRPVQHCWQPTDWLPDASDPDWFDKVQAIREASANLPIDYLVVLVGDMVTEEALPSYMNMLNLLEGTKDETGASSTAWARWTRAWTSEENRHGDLMNRYLYLCGRVDMKAVEVTIQRLIGEGLDPKFDNNPYNCFVYTSFQERATKISHGNTARLSALHGDNMLAKICGTIAADEARHEAGYTAVVSELFRRDPEGAVLAFYNMMKKGIVMPAHLMDDCWHTENNRNQNLFVDYATVADTLGVYSTTDYAQIVEHLVNKWEVSELRLHGEAAQAQEYLCQHPGRIQRLANLQMERRRRDRKAGRQKTAHFSWVGKREVALT